MSLRGVIAGVVPRVKRAVRPLAIDDAGVAAVEFAFYSTIMLTILAGTTDLGIELYTDFQLDNAVNAGAQYVMNNASQVASGPSTLSSNTQSLVENLNGTNWASATVNVNNSNDSTHCYCPTGTPGNWSWGSTVTCGSTCPANGIGGQFVTITASVNITPLFPSFSFVQNGSISRGVLVETQ